MKEKGFTLIELLAVIVILAIIAIIATPIVLNIISETKESSNLRSGEFYLDAVEQAITLKMMSGVNYKYTYCEVLENGNLLCELEEIDIEVSGEKPIGGYILIVDNQIIEGRTIYSENELVFKDNVVGLSEYEIGKQIVFDPGDGERTWNVIGESKDTLTLMLNENVKDTSGDYVNWTNSEVSAKEETGPVLAFQKLSEITKKWNKVDPINDYLYINNPYNDSRMNGYKKLEIKDGITSITSFTGVVNQINNTKARFASMEDLAVILKLTNSDLVYANFIKTYKEILEIANINLTPIEHLLQSYEEAGMFINYYVGIVLGAQELALDIFKNTKWLFNNLDRSDTYSFATLSTFNNVLESGGLWAVSYEGDFYREDAPCSIMGIRPIIEISKNKLNS